MKNKGLLFTVMNVVIYCVGAVIIFGWLTIRASNGGLFTSPEAVYDVVVPSAPVVEANKTPVITEAGVTIGVVTGVDLVEDGARVQLKITDSGPVTIRRDGSARVVIQNIVGEKAIQVLAGDDDEEAADEQMLAYAGDAEVLEASEALAPIEEMKDLPRNPEIQAFVDQQEEVIAAAQSDTDAILTDINALSSMLGAQEVALANIGTRSSNLIDVLAAHGGDIQALVAESAALAGDVEKMLDDDLVMVEKGLNLAADTLTVVAGRANELNYVLGRLPEIAEDMNYATQELLHLLRNERGHAIDLYVWNLPALQEILRILKEEGP